MEVPGGHNNTVFVLLSELLGTAFIMMAVNWGGVSDATPQCVGFTVFICVTFIANIIQCISSFFHSSPRLKRCLTVLQASNCLSKLLRRKGNTRQKDAFDAVEAVGGCLIETVTERETSCCATLLFTACKKKRSRFYGSWSVGALPLHREAMVPCEGVKPPTDQVCIEPAPLLLTCSEE